MDKQKNNIFDIIGIGFGPSNIGLAVMLEEIGYFGSVLFLESNPSATWQPNLSISLGIEQNPLCDIVTPRNPCSQFGFINYMHKSGYLSEFLNSTLQVPLKTKYSAYVEWVAKQFDHLVHYNTEVCSLEVKECENGIPYYGIISKDDSEYKSRSLVIGTVLYDNQKKTIAPFFANLSTRFKFIQDVMFSVGKDYSLKSMQMDGKNPPTYLNVLNEPSNERGISNSFSKIASKAEIIVNSVTKCKYLTKRNSSEVSNRLITLDKRVWRKHLGRDYMALVPEDGKRRHGVALSRLETGGKSTCHKHEVTEGFLILSGTGTIKTENQEVELHEGDIFFVPSQSLHFMENKNEDMLEYLCFWWLDAETHEIVEGTPTSNLKNMIVPT